MQYEKGGTQKESYADAEVRRRICPLCNGDQHTEIHKEREAIGIVKCRKCSLIYTNPLVKESEKNYWGNEKIYYEEGRLILEGKAPSHRDPNYIADLGIIEGIKPQGNFLDIGTNMGLFLRCAQGKAWNLFGIEPSPTLSEMARKYFGLNVKTSYLENAGFEENFFDIVTMTDVFEHIPDPKTMLKNVRRVLKKNGILFIKVPNGNYSLLKLWIAKLMNKNIENDIFDAYEHVVHYTHKSLKGMLENCNFKVKKILIGQPIQLPVWHKYVGHFYLYPSPWLLDAKNHITREIFYYLSQIERSLKFGNIGYLAPNIIVIAEPADTDKV